MGQKLEKLSEKDEESLDNSDWSEQTGETEALEAGEQDEDRDQDSGSTVTSQSIGQISGISVSGPDAGHAGELTDTPARTDPQTGQPIRPLGQQEHPPNTTRRERVGGDRESRTVSQTALKSKTVQSHQETRQSSSKRRGSERKAVACSGTTAMEEQEHGKMKAELGEGEFVAASCDPTNEEDFVVLEEDESWAASDGENNDTFVDRIEKDHRQSPIQKRVGEEAPAGYNDDNPVQPCRDEPREKGEAEKTSRRKLSEALSATTDTVEAHAKTSECFEGDTGPHLAEVTGSRWWLKGGLRVGAARTETTARGKSEGEQNVNDHSKGSASPSTDKDRPSARNASRLVNRLRKGSENTQGETGQVAVQEEEGGEKEGKSNQEAPTAKTDPSSRESKTQGEKTRSAGLFAGKTQAAGADQSQQSTFAGAVSKRAKAGILSFWAKKDDSQASSKATNSPCLNSPTSEAQQQQDSGSFPSEECDLIPCCDGKIEVACLKRESELVCFSAAVTPPPATHWGPKDTSVATQHTLDVMPSPGDPKDESPPKEKPRMKGPPPPVPKKPKNPFIKLKTAQLMSTDVQRRNKDHLRSEDRVKRRHTFHFNKDPPFNPAANQDMCALWDEKGTYAMPPNRRPLSIDLSPWEHLSLGCMDDRYGDMIDFDYCTRVAQLSPEEEPQNLDMVQRRVFLERRSRAKWSPPPVAKRLQNPCASTETLHTPEVAPDCEIQRPKPAYSGRRESYHEPLSERANSQVSNDSGYDNRKDVADYTDRDTSNDVGSYKPVSEIVRETNQMQRHLSRVRPEAAKAQVRLAEQSPSVKVSQMKSTFDVPKKSKERPAEVQAPPKKGTDSFSVLDASFIKACKHTKKIQCITLR